MGLWQIPGLYTCDLDSSVAESKRGSQVSPGSPTLENSISVRNPELTGVLFEMREEQQKVLPVISASAFSIFEAMKPSGISDSNLSFSDSRNKLDSIMTISTYS